MGKIAPEPLIPQRTHSGRSYWVRNIVAPARDDADTNPAVKGASRPNPPPPNQSSPRKRFVEPYRLSSEQRTAMLAPLAERNVGDPESRELFAAALAYDLATCYELTVANTEPERPLTLPEPAVREPMVARGKAASRKTAQPALPGPALTELAEAARVLTGRLDALDPVSRAKLLQTLGEGDRFCRGYDDAYLSSLRGELLRLATGIATVVVDAPAAEPPPSPKRIASPKPSPAACQFIARAAGAFEECFDQAPTAQAGGPFVAILKALVEITGVRIPTDPHNLAALLKRA
jgi:hypothetical protein